MTNLKDFPTVIFIAGTSRSGSTLLDMVLGTQKGCFSVGEMRQLQGYALRSYEKCNFRIREYPLVCTCGKYVDECEFWRRVEQQSRLSFRKTPFKGAASTAYRRLVQLTHMAYGAAGVRVVARFVPTVQNEIQAAQNCFRVYDAIGHLTGVRYIIDSSKVMYHYLLLRAVAPKRIKLIMLYRDGRAVAHSMIRGVRQDLWDDDGESPFAQAARAWKRGNRQLRLFQVRTHTHDKVVVRYEDFCQDPEGELARIKTSLELDLDSLSCTTFGESSHNIGGSPSRFDTNRTIRLDERWKKTLSSEDLETFERIAGKMNRRLGYR